MVSNDIQASISELKRTSQLSLGMIVVGALFLAGTVYYSATRLGPLEQDIRAKREEIAQLEAKKSELVRLAAAAENSARPATPSKQETVGWVYLGRVSGGTWAPKSNRVESSATPDAVTAGSNIKTQQNTSLVDNIDAPLVESSSARQSDSATNFFVKPNTALKILATREQDTIGGGKLLWAKVRVGSENLLQLGR